MQPWDGMTVTVFETGDLPRSWRDAMHELFDETYAQADHDYLDKSLESLRFAAIAVAGKASQSDEAGEADQADQADEAEPGGKGGEAVGFALGETRVLDLPGLPRQRTGLAGLCCVRAAFRNRGLFRLLEGRALGAGTGSSARGRLLAAGRVAHPASLRVMRANAGTLPSPGTVPTAFQREVARGVAACYAVEDFDPFTFVCHGRGRPIGYPRMDIAASAEEWGLFANVDRDRGDSLLALSWIPDAPPAWAPARASAAQHPARGHVGK